MLRGCHSCDRMVVGFTTNYAISVPIVTKVVSLYPSHGEVYSIHHYVIKFVSDLWQVGYNIDTKVDKMHFEAK
jgi:hypothetical protein